MGEFLLIMAGRVGRDICCVLGMVALLLWPALAAAQIGERAAQPVFGPNAVSLPDAPSASVPPPPQVTELAQNRQPMQQIQSWWLVAPQNAPYRPLSSHEKFMSFAHHAYSPYTLGGALYDATWAQAWGDPKEYGSGMQGWGKRLGAAMAGTESRSFFGSFFFPTLLHQDPRYFAMYHGPIVKR